MRQMPLVAGNVPMHRTSAPEEVISCLFPNGLLFRLEQIFGTNTEKRSMKNILLAQNRDSNETLKHNPFLCTWSHLPASHERTSKDACFGRELAVPEASLQVDWIS